MESDVEKGSAHGDFGLITAPESSVDAASNPSSDPSVETPSPRIPKVTSDSFISELVSDRKTSRNADSASPAVLQEEEAIPVEGDVKVPSAGAAVSSNQNGGAPDLRWSNVDLEETQAQSVETAAGRDVADSCSLSSVTTYTLNMEDPYGADEHPLWAWVSGGGCSVDSHSQLNWFICHLNTSCKFSEVQSFLFCCFSPWNLNDFSV